MTRAQAQALATAGGLKENCVVVVTDGPTIGAPGFTSPTEIELNPTSPTELGQTARVFQTYTTEPWAGLYDINLGTSGSIVRLTDNRNNTVIDTDANSPTVHTQFAWGQGTLFQLRDNFVDDSTLTWVLPFTPGFNFTNNTVRESTIDFTGLTTNFFNINNSEFVTTKLVANATSTGSVGISRLKMTGLLNSATLLALSETGTGSVTIRGVEINESSVTLTHASGAVSLLDSTIKGSGGSVVLAASSTINDSVLYVPTINIQTGTTGNNSISRSTFNTSTLTKATGSTGTISMNNATLNNATVTIGAANGATTNSFNNTTIDNSLFSLLGPVAGGGRNDFTSGMKFSGATVNVAANATAGINMQNGWVEQAVINQNQTVGIGALQLFDCSLRGFTTVTCNNTADPGVNGTGLNRITMVDSVITVSGVSGKTGAAPVAQQVDMLGSTLTIPASVGAATFLDKVRMHGCSLNTAGFIAQDSIIDGNFTKTMTANNNNKLANQSFDNWV